MGVLWVTTTVIGIPILLAFSVLSLLYEHILAVVTRYTRSIHSFHRTRLKQQQPHVTGSWMPLQEGPLYYQLTQSPANTRTLLIIPDIPLSTSNDYSYLIPLISLAVNVLVVDLYGCGQSSNPPMRQSPEIHAESIVQLLDALGLNEPTSVLGHGMGSLTAVYLATLHPERVSRLILISPVGLQNPLSLRSVTAVADVKWWTKVWTWSLYKILIMQKWAHLPLVDSAISIASALSYVTSQFNIQDESAWPLVILRRITSDSLCRLNWVCDTIARQYGEFTTDEPLSQLSERILMRRRSLVSLLHNYPIYDVLVNQSLLLDRLKNHPKRLMLISDQNDLITHPRLIQRLAEYLEHAHYVKVETGSNITDPISVDTIHHILRFLDHMSTIKDDDIPLGVLKKRAD
jgi:pimeloyl-ACP methyl ester carboxylesterase